ncbi:MAG TPA: pirin family protein [Actinomycetota bacterium]|nr:pirin family protein [Actinomycetota bacterium]
MIVLSPEDYAVLDEDDFGVPGLVAHEIVGPFVKLRSLGPLIMVHDGVFEPHHGIGHHPHRFNERLFYILEGAVDHDDALNGITGYMGTGDLGRLTEGRRGMLHKEWNNTDGRARAFILVYETDPTPAQASFEALRDPDTPRYEESPGVSTKELVGPSAPLSINGDIRLFADSRVDAGGEFSMDLAQNEGGLLFTVEGRIEVWNEDRESVPLGHTMVVPPADGPRSLRVRAEGGGRVLRVVHGPGRGVPIS